MKASEVLLTAAVSTVMTIGVLLLIDHFHGKEEVQETSDESVVNLREESEAPVEPVESEKPVIRKEVRPTPKKRTSIFGGVKKKVGEAVLSKKLMDEIENRDIFISIDLLKGDRQ